MKNLYIFLILLCVPNIQAQNPPQVKFLGMELHTDYYREDSYPKKLFIDYVTSDSLFLKFPEIIKSFEFNPDDGLISFCKECDLRVNRLKNDIKKQDKGKDLASFWKENLSICYAKYIQTSPELRFAFELQENNTTYHIKEVSVYVYYAKTALSMDKDFFNHKKDEREKLFIDITKTNQEQLIKLSQAHAVKDGGLALNLRLFPSKHWNVSFEKTKVLLHINFKFTNGQIIQSTPFIVEI